jgi:hypothetical protein
MRLILRNLNPLGLFSLKTHFEKKKTLNLFKSKRLESTENTEISKTPKKC